jgi:CheY-like chemotaxis protein
MLVDDNEHDNFFHEREIKKNNLDTVVVAKKSGSEALEYLKSKKNDENLQPDLIFLDINMPGMNGWEFLHEYNQMDKDLQIRVQELQNRVIIVMLTNSENPDDEQRAKTWRFVSDYITKPLTKEKMDDIINTHFIE